MFERDSGTISHGLLSVSKKLESSIICPQCFYVMTMASELSWALLVILQVGMYVTSADCT